MKNVANTIEDLLEVLAGLQAQAKIQIESSDATIMYSIARQVFKGTALTDRQYALMKDKLQTYRNQFTALDYDFDRAVDTLRQPLRHIDRSKYIKIVSHNDTLGPNEIYESYKEKWQWIKIRFPFSKKLIVALDSLNKNSNNYHHQKGSHEHYFKYTESNVYSILNQFKNKDFEIDKELYEVYTKLEKMNNNKKDYLPGIYNLKIKNLNEAAIKYMISSIGEPTIENLCLYKDREKGLGLYYFDQDDLDKSMMHLSLLSKKIVNRNKKQILVKPERYPFINIAESLLELDRFPLLVVLNENNAESELANIHQSFTGFINNSESSVLFRLDNHTNSSFNNYVKNNNLNNLVDKDTKVVYISSNKIPKPLIKAEWEPQTILLMSSQYSNQKLSVITEQADLVIHYDNEMSQMLRFQRQGIQEL